MKVRCLDIFFILSFFSCVNDKKLPGARAEPSALVDGRLSLLPCDLSNMIMKGHGEAQSATVTV